MATGRRHLRGAGLWIFAAAAACRALLCCGSGGVPVRLRGLKSILVAFGDPLLPSKVAEVKIITGFVTLEGLAPRVDVLSFVSPFVDALENVTGGLVVVPSIYTDINDRAEGNLVGQQVTVEYHILPRPGSINQLWQDLRDGKQIDSHNFKKDFVRKCNLLGECAWNIVDWTLIIGSAKIQQALISYPAFFDVAVADATTSARPAAGTPPAGSGGTAAPPDAGPVVATDFGGTSVAVVFDRCARVSQVRALAVAKLSRADGSVVDVPLQPPRARIEDERKLTVDLSDLVADAERFQLTVPWGAVVDCDGGAFVKWESPPLRFGSMWGVKQTAAAPPPTESGFDQALVIGVLVSGFLLLCCSVLFFWCVLKARQDPMMRGASMTRVVSHSPMVFASRSGFVWTRNKISRVRPEVVEAVEALGQERAASPRPEALRKLGLDTAQPSEPSTDGARAPSAGNSRYSSPAPSSRGMESSVRARSHSPRPSERGGSPHEGRSPRPSQHSASDRVGRSPRPSQRDASRSPRPSQLAATAPARSPRPSQHSASLDSRSPRPTHLGASAVAGRSPLPSQQGDGRSPLPSQQGDGRSPRPSQRGGSPHTSRSQRPSQRGASPHAPRSPRRSAEREGFLNAEGGGLAGLIAHAVDDCTLHPAQDRRM